LHIVPVDIDVSDMPQYAELITHQEGLDREKLTPIAKQYLREVPGRFSTIWVNAPM
jgi:hypothetical protein